MDKEPVELSVWSDYLCPWCFNASVRMRALEAEYGDAIAIEWRSYLLRPRPKANRDLERFRAYTKSWLRPAGEADAGTFRVWEGDTPPPTHSLPSHLAARAARLVSEDAFRGLHDRMLRAYFSENRDISSDLELRALWDELGLPADAFESRSDPELRRAVLADHEAALEAGATGVPAVQMRGNPAVIVGAHPLDLYRRWIDRARAGLVERG